MNAFLYLLLISVNFTYINYVIGQDCNLLEVTDEHWNSLYSNAIINDEHFGTLKTFTGAINILGIEAIEGKYAKYISASYDEVTNSVEVYTTEDFKTFEEEITASSPLHMNVSIKFQCNQNVRTLVFEQPIIDTDNHPTVFHETIYNYSLPMPYPPMEFTYMYNIYATDIDFSTNELVFSIEGHHDSFSISYGGIVEKFPYRKTHYAVLSASEYLTLTSEEIFRIKVSDKSNNFIDIADVHIAINEADSLINAPEFATLTYSALYKIQEGNHSLTVSDPVVLSTNPPKTVISLSNTEFFSAALGNGTDIVNVNLIQPLSPDILNNNTMYFLKMAAKVGGNSEAGNAILLIKLPENDCI